MTTSIVSEETSFIVDENVDERRQSPFYFFRTGLCAVYRVAVAMLVYLVVVGVKSVFFDYYNSCYESKHGVYWARSILTSAFGFAVQVVIPYRLIIGTRLPKTLAIFLWLLCVAINSACRATIRHCDIPKEWDRASTSAWAFANDVMSWVVVPLWLYIKLGICQLDGPHRRTRVFLLVVAVLTTIGFDVTRYQLSVESSLYLWGLAIPRAINIVIIVGTYVFRNRNTEPRVFLVNPVNRIELVVLFNLLQSVLNDLSYILRATLIHADEFDITIMDYKRSWIKVPIFFGYTVPMVVLTLIVQQLIKDRVEETTKHLLIFAFTFFQTYLTAMLITSTEQLKTGSLFVLLTIGVFRTLVIYVSLIDGYAKVFALVSTKCRFLCCKKSNTHTSDAQVDSRNFTDPGENTEEGYQQTKTSGLFNREGLAATHESIATDRIVERIAAVNCYLAAVVIFLAIHFFHPAAESQLTVDRDTLATRAEICAAWAVFELIISLILMVALHYFDIQLNSLRPQLYDLSSTTCLFIFILIILSYVTQTYRLWQ